MNNSWIRLVFIPLFVFLIAGGVFLMVEASKYWQKDSDKKTQETIVTIPVLSPTALPTNNLVISPSPFPTQFQSPTPSFTLAPMVQSVLYDVPFASQAPSAQWDDDTYQNGCEEAAMLMAIRWVEGKALTKVQAESEIAKIADYERQAYGQSVDHNADDTAQIMRDYFKYENVSVIDEAGSDEIIAELMNGNLVIAPMNGQELGNPNFTAPGPLQHMVVVIGYDIDTNEFITNDPGTRNGKGYRYDTEVFVNAMRDYPTGEHEPIVEVRKPVIVVSK